MHKVCTQKVLDNKRKSIISKFTTLQHFSKCHYIDRDKERRINNHIDYIILNIPLNHNHA